MIRKPDPDQISAYLTASGWRRSEEFGKFSAVFIDTYGNELVVPRTRSIADYERVLTEILDHLSSIESRPKDSIEKSITGIEFDVIRFRAPNAFEDGSLPIAKGLKLINGALALLLASACSNAARQPVFRPGNNKEANSFVDRVRIGQTEEGSFVLPVYSPLTRIKINQISMFPELLDPPIERKILAHLSIALQNAKNASDLVTKTGNFSHFDSVVQYGVSSNLCDAVVDLIDAGGSPEIIFSWSPFYQTPNVPESQVFDPKDKEILEDASKNFKNREPKYQTTLVGYVGSLERRSESDTGKISIITVVDDAPASVKATLTGSDYEFAITAHRDRIPIRIAGDLVRIGNRWQLNGSFDVGPVGS